MLSYSKYAITLFPILSILIGYTLIQALKTDADITIEDIDSEEYLDNLQIQQNRVKYKSRFLVLVSLLDGRVAALDAHGQQKWIIGTGNQSLVSSSISRVVVTRNGIDARIIPSLDGALYQLDDGGGVEPFPLDAEALMSSSFRMGEDTSIVGGKYSERYGVNVDTGKLHYVCGLDGCNTFSKTNFDGILSIQRHTKTIRAIDVTTGYERWNFSVSEHSMTYSKASKSDAGCQRKNIVLNNVMDRREDDEDDNSCTGDNCNYSLDKDQIKVIVSDGVIFATSEKNSNDVLWKNTFDAAIANAWILNGDELSPLNLFDRNHLMLAKCNTKHCHSSAPLIYLGQHNNQVYVMPSEELKKEVKSVQNYASMMHINMPHLRWHPLPRSNNSETPLIDYKISVEKEYEEGHEKGHADKMKTSDMGSYLYPEDKNKCESSFFQRTMVKDEHKEKTLRNWWKEVMALSITMSVMLHILIQKIIVYKDFFYSQDLYEDIPLDREAKVQSNAENSSEDTENKMEEFVSRFCTDFDTLRCLGKGGFGVVFDVKNKMDDYSYAVKRISLKNSETARSKVIREVKALAKLSHPGIVRYHQSWFESPPIGWLEQHDQNIKGRGLEGWTNSESMSLNSESTATEATQSIMCIRRTRKGTICADDSGCNNDFAVTDWPDFATTESWDQMPSDTDSYDSYDGMYPSSSSSDDVEEEEDDKTTSFDRIDSSDGIVFLGDTDDSSVDRAVSIDNVARRKRSKRAAKNHDDRLILYIQMQLCQTRSLRDWLRENSLTRDRDQIYDIFDQIVVAVDYVHSCGMMHRDLKPSNIFFSVDGSIKIGDFGLATTLEDDSHADSTSDLEFGELRSRGKMYTDCVGTKLYMSPEQIKGDNYTYKVDIYALGMIFFELFFPFTTEMERVNTLSNVKIGLMPERFTKDLVYECEFVKPLLSISPDRRPDTRMIRDHNLFFNFESQRKLVSKLRIRTTTESSK